MRDSKIKDLRPEIEGIDDTSSLPRESFQNRTLRPILKLQHPLTSALLDTNAHFAKHIPHPSSLTLDQYTKEVTKFISTNKEIRTQILGVIIGMMTLEEYREYAEHKSEYNKRIISMQLKRYLDSY